MIYNINIAIADDHIIFRQGIEVMLKFTPGMSVVIKASNGADLISLVKERQPDVVLLDLKMPVMDGLATLPLLKSDYPNIKVIILPLFEDNSLKQQALEFGADAFLGKTSDPGLIIHTIKECCKQVIAR